MTRAKKVRKERLQQAASSVETSRPSRVRVGVFALGAAALAIGGAFVWRSTGSERPPIIDPGPVHVHGLGVNPADGALFIATHSGLYRVGTAEQRADRVGDRLQDTMGFTIVGPDRFLGSGHPDLWERERKDLPSHLGLIESDDAGESWEPVSLLGEADFHVLRLAGQRVYGYDASNDRLLVSGDRGRSWEARERPGPLLDIAVAPRAAERIIAASAGGAEEGLFESRNGGRVWNRISKKVGLLAWPRPDRLYLAAVDGQLFVSPDGGNRLVRRGEIGGEPAALLATGEDELYVALHNGTVKRSTNGGRSWGVRSTP